MGLGNPGAEYANTRHNVGYRVVDELARCFPVQRWRTKHNARQAFVPQKRVLLIAPTSFMNASGVPIRLIASWHRVPPQSILVISDDIDLPFGKLRMRAQGGHGGHNGLRSVVATIGDGFPRLRVGIGRPERDSIEHVLAPFTERERAFIPDILSASTQAAQLWLDDGIERAMQFVNSWTREDRGEPGAGGQQ
ncbi:MAG: aminoacyl-tRNA hydrolase [Candidatus Eremiobacteraeota bacterium]|nr:aminoacyl-tRNA hydrolase [Candidatus Eremiobacteraeota bacterium]